MLRLLFILLSSLLAVSCGGRAVVAGGTASFDPVAGITAPAPNADYRINPLDTLRIVVFQEPELSVDGLPVATNGQIALPLVGQILAQGRTATELAGDIRARLTPYVVKPDVSVNVLGYTSQRVTVEGAVQKPGIYSIPGQASLLEAIALAQGTNDYALLRQVVVFRQIADQRFAAKFDVADIQAGLAADPQIQAGDVVVVGYSSARRRFADLLTILPSAAGIFIALIPRL